MSAENGNITAIQQLLIAPEGIEIPFVCVAPVRMTLLIAPEGIEITFLL